MTGRARLRSDITPAQRIFFEHLNGSKTHPTNAPQTQDEPLGRDRAQPIVEDGLRGENASKPTRRAQEVVNKFGIRSDGVPADGGL